MCVLSPACSGVTLDSSFSFFLLFIHLLLSVVLGVWSHTHESLGLCFLFFVAWKMCHLGTKRRTLSALSHHHVTMRKQTQAKCRERKERERWFAHFSWVKSKVNKCNRCKKAAVAEYWLHVTSAVPTLCGSRGTAPLVLYWFKLIRSFFFFFLLLLVPWHNNLYKSSSCIFWGTPTSLWGTCCWRKQNLLDGPIRHLPQCILFLPFKMRFYPQTLCATHLKTPHKHGETSNGHLFSAGSPSHFKF